MKKILSVEEYIPGILIIKLEATKRIKMWVKIDRRVGDRITACDDLVCPFYRTCPILKSPLKKYPTFGEFCNHLFTEYPDLPLQLATKFKVFNINQVVPIKKPKRI
jgi:hypothetical protein